MVAAKVPEMNDECTHDQMHEQLRSSTNSLVSGK